MKADGGHRSGSSGLEYAGLGGQAEMLEMSFRYDVQTTGHPPLTMWPNGATSG